MTPTPPNAISSQKQTLHSESQLLKNDFICSRDMFNFYFLEKGLGIVSPPHFVYDFKRKIFLILHSITDQISLPNCLYFLIY